MPTAVGLMFMVALLLMRPFRRLARHYGDRLQARREGQLAAVSEFVGSLKMARSMNLEDRYLGLFSAILGQTKADAREFTRQSTIGSGLFQFAVASGALAEDALHLAAAGSSGKPGGVFPPVAEALASVGL